MPRKRFGQHFLSDPNILGRIVDFSRVGPSDQVVEIGPGRGALTQVIAERVRQVVALEIDRDLIDFLRGTLWKNVNVIEQDALKTNFDTILSERYHLLGNLPYSISTPLLERFINARKRILSVTIMVQMEVANRILAEPGCREYSPLSIGVQYYARIERGFTVPPGAFIPKPKVHSTVIRLTWRDGVRNAPELMAFVRKAFSARRKKLVNNLCGMYRNKTREDLISTLKATGIDTDTRPENLSVEDYVRLFQAMKHSG